MSGLKEIKRRQKTAQVIERMTSAMKMISRARYTAMQNEVRKNSGLTEILQGLVEKINQEMHAQGKALLSNYAQEGPADAPWLLLVMTSDSGLCGGFNQKLIKLACDFLEARPTEAISVVCLGKKGLYGLQKKSGINLRTDCPGTDTASVISWVTSLFKNKEIRGCFVVYAQFCNILKQEPVVLPLLPMMHTSAGPEFSNPSIVLTDSEEIQDSSPEDGAFVIEPDAETVLDGVSEMLVQSILKKITGEHKLSEHAARMNAMDSASSNAQEMIRRLQIKYNRVRQDRITKEIIEIVSGSETAAE